jgi:hypothetical protein
LVHGGQRSGTKSGRGTWLTEGACLERSRGWTEFRFRARARRRRLAKSEVGGTSFAWTLQGCRPIRESLGFDRGFSDDAVLHRGYRQRPRSMLLFTGKFEGRRHLMCFHSPI